MRIVFIIILILYLLILIYCDKDKTTAPDSAANIPPICQIMTAGDDSTETIGSVAMYANASDSDGHIESVEFYVDDELVFTDYSELYGFIYRNLWLQAGYYNLKAIATDNDGARTESEMAVYFNLFPPVNSSPDTIFVPQDYPTIQDAIDNSLNGDVVLVSEGAYEGHVEITHPVILIGAGENTLIDDDFISISSDYVYIKNLRIGNHSSYLSGFDGHPGIEIQNSSYVLIDSVISEGAPCNAWIPFPEMPWLIWCTNAGAGLEISSSSHITVQYSYFRGGVCDNHNCEYGAPGHGSDMDAATAIFIVDTTIDSYACGVKLSNYSQVAIKGCNANGDLCTDVTSTVIFP